MGKRGSGNFRRTDALRAVRAARDAGIAPAMIEIVGKDGVTIRVFGRDAYHGTQSTNETTNEWLAELAVDKAKAEKEWADEVERVKAGPPIPKRPRSRTT
jgi:hypothetical protein